MARSAHQKKKKGKRSKGEWKLESIAVYLEISSKCYFNILPKLYNTVLYFCIECNVTFKIDLYVLKHLACGQPN